jgi:hypothetical protein
MRTKIFDDPLIHRDVLGLPHVGLGSLVQLLEKRADLPELVTGIRVILSTKLVFWMMLVNRFLEMAFFTNEFMVSSLCSQYMRLLLGQRYPVMYMTAMLVLMVLWVSLGSTSILPFLTAYSLETLTISSRNLSSKNSL